MNPFLKARLAFLKGSKEIDRRTTMALRQVAFLILADAVRRAPVLTGALRASGRTRALNQHRIVIEFGGRGTGVDYAPAVEFGTFRTPPKPFLRPALKAKRKEIKSTIKRKALRPTLRMIAKEGSSRR